MTEQDSAINRGAEVLPAFVFAHVSDIHVDSGERSAERTRRVADYLAGLRTPVDAVLITGDVADHGTEAEYERVRRLIDLPVPVLFCPGNHDVREPFRKVLLAEPPTGGPINRAFRVGGVLFAMCDSTIPGRDDGLLAAETLGWLDATLAAAADAPAFVCFHHPPAVLGMPYIDSIRQREAEHLAELVGRHANVVALLCGHAHTPAATTFAGKPLIVAPGVVSTTLLPSESEALIDERLPPMLALHVFDRGERRLTTHYRVVQ